MLLSSIDLTAGSLTYTSSSANTLTVTFDNKSDVDPSNDVYHFADTETITATGTGVTGSGTMMVDVLTAGVTSININMDTTGNTTIGGLTLSGDLTVTAKTVSLFNSTVSSATTVTTGDTTIGGLTLSGDLTVTAKTVTLNNGTVSSDTTVTINADGAVTNANADPALVAIAALDLVITTTGTGSAVGTASNPITTSLGSLTAVTNDGGVYVSDFNSSSDDSGMIISDVLAKEGGFAPLVNGSNQVVVRTSNANANTRAGTFDVIITAQGNIVLTTVTAPRVVTITAGGMIVDVNQGVNNLLGRTVNLIASESVGQQPDPIELTGESFSSSTTNGSIFLSEQMVGAVGTIMAGGTGNEVVVTSSSTTLRLGSITASGNVTVTNEGGALVDNNSGALNISGAKVLLIGKSGIGTSSDPIETTASEINATAKDVAAKIFITESDELSFLSVTTNNSNVGITFTGGSFSFNPSTSVLNASAVALSFENLGGDVKLGVIDAGSSDISIKAFGAIKDDASSNDSIVDLIGGIVNLTSTTGIGAIGNTIDTDVGTLIVTTSGVVQIREANALSLSVSGPGGNIDVLTITGDLTLTSVSSSGSVTLQAGGAILDGNGSAINVSGSSLNITASNGIGTASDGIETSVSTLTADGGSGGGLFLDNKKALTLLSATATGGDVSVTTVGDLTLNTVFTTGSATVSATGAVTDGNADSVNVTATSATLKGASFGASDDKIETSAAMITALTSSGGIFVSNSGVASLALKAIAFGQTADIDIDTSGDIVLDVATAKGDLVKLVATGAITDGNDTINPTINITAKSADISAPEGIGTAANPLELDIDQILRLNGGDGGGEVTNAGPLAVSEEALESSGTGDLVFNADTVTILDIVDNQALVALNRNLVFKTQTGHIVMNDPADTIQTQGTGSITVQAGLIPGSRGVAVLGNLKTGGADITVTADRNITIGQLDAGTGNVTVQSRSGLIVDGNGEELNVIAHDAVISGVTPSLRSAELDEITKVADAAGKRGEAAAKQSSYDSFFAASVISTAAENSANDTRDDAQIAFDTATAASEAQALVVRALEIDNLILGGVELALDVTGTLVGLAAATANAVPFTGDGGTATIAFFVTLAKNITSAIIYSNDVDLFTEGEKDGLLSGIATEASEELVASEHTLFLATETRNAFLEAVSISLAASIKSAIARDAAARVSEQSTLARDQNNVMSTPDQPLGIRVSGIATLTAPNGDILLEVFGSATINAGSLVLSGGFPDAITLANPGVKFTLTTNETIGSLAGVTGSNVILGNNTLTTGRNDTNTTYAGVISGTGALTKEGIGTFTLSGANTYTGATTVSVGRLDVNGSTAAGSVVTVQDTATLGGTGTVAGTTNVLNGGTVSPGTSPGILRTATATFNSGSTFALDIAGTTPGNGDGNYDQMNVTGNNRTTTLGGAELVFNLTAASHVGQVYRIVDSTGTRSTVSGTFKYRGFTLNQGDVFTVDSTIFRINYNPSGASGDVILTEIPGETTADLSDGVLTITDTGRTSNDRLTLSLDNLGNVLLHDPKNGIAGTGGVMSGTVPLTSLNQIVINSGDGTNALIVDFTNGNPLPSGGLVYNAGNSGGGDSLLLNNLGIPFSSVTYQPANTRDATFLLISAGSQPILLAFKQVESMTLDGTQAVNLIFDMPATNDTVALADLTGAGGVGKQRFTGSASPTLDFSVAGITGLTVNGNNGNDSLKINSLDPAFAAGITLNGGEGNDVIDATGSKKTVGRTTIGVGTVQNGGIGEDKLTGGIGDDTLSGNGGKDVIKGGAGNDAILGGDGNDQLFGDAGNDTITGGADNDSILGGAGNDVLAGEAGSDTVKGEAGSDFIAGGSGLGADLGDVVTDRDGDINEDMVLVFNDVTMLFEDLVV